MPESLSRKIICSKIDSLEFSGNFIKGFGLPYKSDAILEPLPPHKITATLVII
tara:strand:- start:325 stop:483 length:159 start_codon:yes stop_codon:yes gene_type:complete